MLTQQIKPHGRYPTATRPPQPPMARRLSQVAAATAVAVVLSGVGAPPTEALAVPVPPLSVPLVDLPAVVVPPPPVGVPPVAVPPVVVPPPPVGVPPVGPPPLATVTDDLPAPVDGVVERVKSVACGPPASVLVGVLTQYRAPGSAVIERARYADVRATARELADLCETKIDVGGPPGYDLAVAIGAPRTGALTTDPNELVDDTRPTIRVRKLQSGLLPVRLEIVLPEEGRSVHEVGVLKTTFGFDALDTDAPRSFTATLQLDDAPRGADRREQHVSLDIDSPSASLAVVTETFSGDVSAPVDQRRDRAPTLLRYRALPAAGLRIPRHATIHVVTTLSEEGTVVRNQTVKLTRSDPTYLDFDTSAPGGTRLHGTINQLPQELEVSVSGAGNFVSYVARGDRSRVGLATVNIERGASSVLVRMINAPRRMTLQQGSYPDPLAAGQRVTTIVYGADEPADSATVELRTTGEQGDDTSRSVTLAPLPKELRLTLEEGPVHTAATYFAERETTATVVIRQPVIDSLGIDGLVSIARAGMETTTIDADLPRQFALKIDGPGETARRRITYRSDYVHGSLRYNRRVEYRGAPVPVRHADEYLAERLPGHYPVSDFTTTQRASLAPLPRFFELCSVDEGNDCTFEVFRPGMFEEFTTAGNVGTSKAKGGSLRIIAEPRVQFSFNEVRPAPTIFTYSRPRGLFPGIGVKPGISTTGLNLNVAQFALQSHEESSGTTGHFVGFTNQGYLAMDTGWTAPANWCAEAPVLPCGPPPYRVQSDHLPSAPPADDPSGMSGIILRTGNLNLPSEVEGVRSTVPGARRAGEEVTLQFGRPFVADHRVFEYDPDELVFAKSYHGHVYCGPGTSFRSDGDAFDDVFC